MSPRKTNQQPVIRVAPPGELQAFVVFEHQLDRLAQGSPAALLLNFSLFFLGVAVTALGTLATSPPESDRTYYTFLVVCLVTAIAGLVLLAVWCRSHQVVGKVLEEIKSQMPPNPPVQEDSAPGGIPS